MAAERIRAVKSALECKQIGNTVLPSTSWLQDAPKVMEKIVYTNEKVFAQSVYDQFWGTGRTSTQTVNKIKGVAGAKMLWASCCNVLQDFFKVPDEDVENYLSVINLENKITDTFCKENEIIENFPTLK